MMSLWDALRMNMMISYQELVRTFLSGEPVLKALEELIDLTNGIISNFVAHCSGRP